MTGTSWLEESGLAEGPIALTNTQSVGVVRDAMVDWIHRHFPQNEEEAMLPIVGETDDSWVNDLFSFHVKRSHVFEAADKATGGPIEEGNVGAGTGTVTFRFKSGIGTSSRVIEGGYVVGVLVQSNFGVREDMLVAGIPVGRELKNVKLPLENPLPRRDGSINVVLITDAPLLPHQMKRVMKRAAVGLARDGSLGRNSSGDFFVGVSTALPETDAKGLLHWTSLPNDKIDAVFAGAVEATEEAIVNALVAAEDQSGVNGNTYYAVPHEKLQDVLRKYNRLGASTGH
jgi:L-aminopeptidase/D-esterase-like protein